MASEVNSTSSTQTLQENDVRPTLTQHHSQRPCQMTILCISMLTGHRHKDSQMKLGKHSLVLFQGNTV